MATKIKKKIKYLATVTRTSYSEKEFEVSAANAEEAKDLAIEMGCNHYFDNEYSADLSVELIEKDEKP